MSLKTITFAYLISLLAVSCNTKNSKSDIDITFTKDTLNIGYTYWWPQSGPFIGSCNEELSLVFTGTIINLKKPSTDPGPLYIAQKGTIEIEQLFKIKDLRDKTYVGQKFITTDCFYGQNFNIGDKVLVFCYDFEGNYTIPGHKSILNIVDFNDNIVSSIRRYIKKDQNPSAIKKDVKLWGAYNLDKDLQQLIDCSKELNTK